VDVLEFLFAFNNVAIMLAFIADPTAVKGAPPLWCCGIRAANDGGDEGVSCNRATTSGLEFSICQLVSC
jgi:hypothetical protein